MKTELISFVVRSFLPLCVAAPLAATSYQSVPTAGTSGDTGAEVRGNLRVEDPASGAGSNDGLTLSYSDAASPVVFLGTSKPWTWWYWVGSAQTNGVFDPEGGDLLMALT